LFNDWEMSNELYAEIVNFTTGKEKTRLFGFQKQRLLN